MCDEATGVTLPRRLLLSADASQLPEQQQIARGRSQHCTQSEMNQISSLTVQQDPHTR